LLSDALTELKYLESVHYMLEASNSDDDITEIRNELMSVGIINKKSSTKNKPKNSNTKASKPYHFISCNGYDIYVGKNSIQNERITLKESNSNDIWLHTKDIPGSHVIIKKQKDEIPESTILEAAFLAAYFSKVRLSSKVPVDYTIVKYVKKIPGSKPGMVTYSNHKTIFVSPDEEMLKKIQNNIKDVSYK
jgi:predicted ribosome quality control (RQC) complex YloA/Tae2 family protein